LQLVFATHNKNKLKEVQKLLPASITLLSLDDIGCTQDIPETESTLEGNALLKARYIKNNYGLNCFADDTGLEIQALNNAPGVYSARYAGPSCHASDNINKVLKQLENKEHRKARFKTVIALLTDTEEKLFTGICEGTITTKIIGKDGFGYDPIFKPDGKSKTFAELTTEEKNSISHRGKAFKQLIEHLSTISR
jgi:XTP/dITP diphosphohydrolase